MRENPLENVVLEHKMTKQLVENKIREISKNIETSCDRVKYYTDMLQHQKSKQRIEEFTNMVDFEVARLKYLTDEYNSFKIHHAEYFI